MLNSFTAVGLVVVGVIVQAELLSSEPCQCTFTSVDPLECAVYGSFTNGTLVSWPAASRQCLDAFQINEIASDVSNDVIIDPDVLSLIFPNPNGEDGDASALVDYLRSNDGLVASRIKAKIDEKTGRDFFVESTVFPEKMELREEILVSVGLVVSQGMVINKYEEIVCSADKGGSESACWDAIGKSLEENYPGYFRDIGKELHREIAFRHELEQSFVRIRICQEGASTECAELSDRVESVKAGSPDLPCSSFGRGPVCFSCPPVPPVCEKDTDENTNMDTNKDGSNSSRSPPTHGTVVAVVCAILMITVVLVKF